MEASAGVITPNQIPLTTIVTYLHNVRSRISNHWACIQCGTSHLQKVQENILSHIILATYRKFDWGKKQSTKRFQNESRSKTRLARPKLKPEVPGPARFHWATLLICLFFLLCGAIFWIDYRIIESIGHLSFCKKIDVNGGDSEKKFGHVCLVFCRGRRKKKYIFYKQKEKKKRRKDVVIGIWSHPLIVRISFVLPTCTHTLSCWNLDFITPELVCIFVFLWQW